MSLEQRLAVLDLLETPVWVFDLDQIEIPWANRQALDLWGAASCEELRQRDLSDISEAVKTRLRSHLLALRDGGRIHEEWTFYPHGKPVPLTLHLSGIALDDGRLAFLAQGVPKEQPPDQELVRGIEALRHTSLAVSLLDLGGALLMQNPACFRAFGRTESFHAWFAAEVSSALLSAVEAGNVFSEEVVACTLEGERWHAVEARPTRDPVTGGPGILMFQVDVTARRSAEHTAETQSRMAEELSRHLAVIERQHREILSLSAPIIDVGRRTLILPLIGALYKERSAEIMERLLSAVHARRASCVILDLTGAGAIDGAGAARLIGLVRAVQLLGALPVLTGLRPAVARAIVDTDTDMSHLVILHDLRQGIDASRRIETGASGDATSARRDR